MSAYQLAADSSAATRGAARWYAQSLMARHLRFEHRWGIRRIGKELGMTDSEVKRACGE